jgi:radical SAM superfamily enzyme YgiQ (UPF0313 family)
MIHDDCLTEDRPWCLNSAIALKRRLRAPFVAQSRADIICDNADMIKVMSKAGLRLMIIGFESGSIGFKIFAKGCTVEKCKAARICHELGIKIWANYVLGLPTETKGGHETYTMLKEIKPYHCSPAFIPRIPAVIFMR